MNIKIGIIGAAGYTAGELFRILINHPQAQIVFAHSNSNAGNPIHHVHKDLLGEIDMAFTDQLLFEEVDAIFLCMGHGASKKFLEEQSVPSSVKIIDLSHDFRLYDGKHDFIYALPEMNKSEVASANHIANPGCFATCIQLALLPLAQNGALTGDVHVNAITGSTGAGQKPTATSHFSWRNSNISVYKAFSHQHLGEIRQSLTGLQPSFEGDINFIPVRGNFTRGIMATAYIKTDMDEAEAQKIFAEYYEASPFVFVTDTNPDVKQVVNTNKGIVFVEKHGEYLLVISMIDNLLKGASGQAAQNMNLAFGIAEDAGLRLKPSSF